MALIMTRFAENLDNDGNITQVNCGLSWQNNAENFAASVVLLPADLTDGSKLDDKTKNDIFKLAATKFLTEATTAVNDATKTAQS